MASTTFQLFLLVPITIGLVSGWSFCSGDGDCLNGGTCINPGLRDSFCRCPMSRAGERCEYENPCEASVGLCKNGGSCELQLIANIDGTKSLSSHCKCAPGYTGTMCQLMRNDTACFQNPCRNFGVCQLDPTDTSKFRCQCSVGYRGQFCQLPDFCASRPCRNGATCENLPSGKFRCHCTHGFRGVACADDINECLLQPCHNNGTCINMHGTFQCRCPVEFTGQNCSQEFIPCQVNPCHHGGRCVPTDAYSFKCDCPRGTSGRVCQENRDECVFANCGLGTCVDSIDSYRCKCPPSLRGPHCRENVNECLLEPCANGGTCLDFNPYLHSNKSGYACVCVSGYTGENCTININDCSPNPCFNGGTCIDLVGNFKCTCPKEYFGIRCQLRNPCLLHPCRNNGTCSPNPSTGQHSCQCPRGVYGEACEIDDDECTQGASSPCAFGTCVNTLGSYKCICNEGYTGSRCDEQINDCEPNPCMNGGTCIDSTPGFYCVCRPGFTGPSCQNPTDVCQMNSCLNGGTCYRDHQGNAVCHCPAGFGGASCQHQQSNPCRPNPCRNGALCTVTHNHYQCVCISGYSGTHCELGPSYCDSDATCAPHGSCIAQRCHCLPGWTGYRCQINYDECSSSPCLNGAYCEDLDSSYRCRCVNGYSGERCEVSPNRCASNPCLNSGKCVTSADLDRGYLCICDNGWTGLHCGQLVDPCDRVQCSSNDVCQVTPDNRATCVSLRQSRCTSQPCLNGASCVDAPQTPHGYRCHCIDGFTGQRCEDLVNYCERNPCRHGGTCRPRRGGYSCQCAAGFDGQDCEHNRDDCMPNPCGTNGRCVDGINTYECKCDAGFEGRNCTIALRPCLPSPCRNGAVCTPTPDYKNFTCAASAGSQQPAGCPIGFKGRLCELNVNECVELRRPCQRGLCRDTHGSYYCECPAGWEGQRCDVDTDECQSDPCLNGGTCEDLLGDYVCNCRAGFEGRNCEVDIDECLSKPCQNGATCRQFVNSYTCACRPGYSGRDCERNDDDCTASSCLFGGTCIDGENDFECRCAVGYTGRNCEHRLNPCRKFSCLNGGNCSLEPVTLQPQCSCAYGYAGTHCDRVRDLCMPNPCVNGRCQQVGVTWSCHCNADWSGDRCDVPSVTCQVAAQRRGVPVSSLCSAGGRCENIGDYHRCICPRGFEGSYCEREVNECESQPCLNGATCTDLVGAFSCRCPPGYRGSRCEIDVNECASNPCQNGATCHDLAGAFHCSCRKGTSGDRCQYNADDCFTGACFHHGTCEDRIGGFSCRCAPGYVGDRCEGDVNECANQPCSTTGTHKCIPGDNDYQCVCKTGYEGKNCSRLVDWCAQNPCKNGASCTNSLVGPVCHCRPGYVDELCGTLLGACISQPCRHNATCQPSLDALVAPAGFRCLCPAGLSGVMCEIDVRDECSSYPCAVGATCIDGPASFKCLCATGYGGLTCHDPLDPKDLPIPHWPPLCRERNCPELYANGKCDIDCNIGECRFDGGDCSAGVEVFRYCTDIVNRDGLHCWQVYNNSRCDAECNREECAFDGLDCWPRLNSCNGPYRSFCLNNYANGYCDTGCNTAECLWDGGDCLDQERRSPKPIGRLRLVFAMSRAKFEEEKAGQLQLLGHLLRAVVTIARDEYGREMIREIDLSTIGTTASRSKRSTELDASPELSVGLLLRVRREAHFLQHFLFEDSLPEDGLGGALSRVRREPKPAARTGVEVYVDVDISNCLAMGWQCFNNTEQTIGVIVEGYQNASTSLLEIDPVKKEPQPAGSNALAIGITVGVAVVLLVIVVLVGFKRRSVKRIVVKNIWTPPDFATTPSNDSDTTSIDSQSLPAKRMRTGSAIDSALELSPMPSSKKSAKMLSSRSIKAGPYTDAIRTEDMEREGRVMPAAEVQVHRSTTTAATAAATTVLPDSLWPSALTPPREGEDDPIHKAAHIDAAGPDGVTPLMLASSRPPAPLAATVGVDGSVKQPLSPGVSAAQIISDLISQGADIHARSERWGETPLHFAARYRRADAAKQLLAAGADPNARDYKGCTPLHTAIASEAIGVFSLLLDCGKCDLNARARDGSTPLILAVRLADDHMTQELLSREADVDAHDDNRRTALHWAAFVNNTSAIKKLLYNQCNKDAQDGNDQTALFLAAKEGCFDSVKLLLEAGANRKLPDQMDMTPRMVARKRFHDDIVALFDDPRRLTPPGLSMAELTSQQPLLSQRIDLQCTPFTSNSITNSLLLANGNGVGPTTPTIASSGTMPKQHKRKARSETRLKRSGTVHSAAAPTVACAAASAAAAAAQAQAVPVKGRVASKSPGAMLEKSPPSEKSFGSPMSSTAFDSTMGSPGDFVDLPPPYEPPTYQSACSAAGPLPGAQFPPMGVSSSQGFGYTSAGHTENVYLGQPYPKYPTPPNCTCVPGQQICAQCQLQRASYGRTPTGSSLLQHGVPSSTGQPAHRYQMPYSHSQPSFSSSRTPPDHHYLTPSPEDYLSNSSRSPPEKWTVDESPPQPSSGAQLSYYQPVSLGVATSSVASSTAGHHSPGNGLAHSQPHQYQCLPDVQVQPARLMGAGFSHLSYPTDCSGEDSYV